MLFFSIRIYLIWLVLLLVLPLVATAQVSPPDSIRFAKQVQVWPELFGHKDSMPDWQVATIHAVLGERAAAQRLLFERDEAVARDKAEALLRDIELLKSDTTIGKDSIATLTKQARFLQKQEKLAQKNAQQAAALEKKATEMALLPTSKQRAALAKNFKAVTSLEAKYAAQHAPPPPAQPESKPVEAPAETLAENTEAAADTTTDQGRNKLGQLKKRIKPKEKEPEKPKPAQYDPKLDVMLNPPNLPCNFAVERRDPFTGAVYRETDKHELLRFTNNIMKKNLPEGQAHIQCRAALADDGGGGRILLEFTIRDANARRTFGGIPPKSILSLLFLDGERITLFNDADAEGQFDPETGTAVFRGSYPIQTAALRKLTRSELDQIRVAWSTGYEDYQVQHIGLFQQLGNCIK